MSYFSHQTFKVLQTWRFVNSNMQISNQGCERWTIFDFCSASRSAKLIWLTMPDIRVKCPSERRELPRFNADQDSVKNAMIQAAGQPHFPPTVCQPAQNPNLLSWNLESVFKSNMSKTRDWGKLTVESAPKLQNLSHMKPTPQTRSSDEVDLTLVLSFQKRKTLLHGNRVHPEAMPPEFFGLR